MRTNSLWLAIYAISAAIAAIGAVLIAIAVEANRMQIAGAAGATFLAVLTIAMTAHKFVKGR